VQPAVLSFTAQSGGPPAVAKPVNVSSLLTNLGYLVAAEVDTGDWLIATPESGLMPGVVQVTADPADLPPGVYEGRVTITAPNASPAARTTIVRFTVTEADAPTLSAGPGAPARHGQRPHC